MTRRVRWVPALLLLGGIVLNVGLQNAQRAMPLRAPLEAVVRSSWRGYRASDLPISKEEARAAGMSDYLLRVYEAPGTAPFSVYVGYYARQERGRVIHSPRNCLPGAGWEPLESREETVRTALGSVRVDRYLIQNGSERALVYYWYQGRGRVSADEYTVKWELLRDRVLRNRSDEALVRVLVPLRGPTASADRLLTEVTRSLVPALARSLPS